jgi:signal transduction histidine kinase
MNSVPTAAETGGDPRPSYYERLRELVRRDDDPSDRLQRILRLGADWFGVEQGLLARVDPAGTTYTIDEVSAPRPDLTRGLTGNLLSTYCRMVVAEQETLALEHNPEQGESAYRSALLATFIGAPVQVNGEPYGTVCFVDLVPEASSFDDEDQAFLDRVAEAAETVLEASTDGEASPSQVPPPSSAVERRYRTALKHSPIIFAKVDDELRYEWIHNPHPDFDPTSVVGKRDDEIDSGPGVQHLMNLKRRTLESGRQIREEIVFERSDGLNIYDVTVTPLREGGGEAVTGLITASLNITERKEAQSTLVDRREKIQALYETTSRLPRAQRPDAVVDHLHALLEHFFDYPITAVNLRHGDVLVPERASVDGTDEMPDVQPLPVEGNSVVAQAYRTEDTVVVEDVSALDNDVDYGPIRSAAGVPIEGHGAVVVGRTADGGFDSFLLRLVDILTAYAAAVLDRIDRQRTLLEAKEAAEQAARLKTAMLSNMSHEIRTPLTSIISFAGILEDTLSGQNEKYARLVRQGGKRLMGTLDSVLQLSKLEAGVDEATRRPVCLRESARTAVEAHEQAAEEAGVSLALDLPDAPVVARANETAVDQVVGNLVDNALKFTPEGGTVWVRVRPGDEAACLAVEDTGIGIGEAALPDIFDAFEQESTGLTREYEGSGLGLAVAQRLVDQLGGALDVESETGEGSCFTVRLPRADDPT